jgi:tripartite-type tricarboxylate transporter receptor subunit TctC
MPHAARFATALITAGATLSALWATPAAADGGLYQGKRLTLYIGTGPGNAYDIYGRLLSRHFGKHIAGQPLVVVQNRPGAGGLQLANELYNTLPADGTVIGMLAFGLHIQQTLGEPGIKFVSNDFHWIGRLADVDPLVVVRPDSPAKTVEEAKSREVVVGVPGVASAAVLSLFALNNLQGTKFKLIAGYQSGGEIKTALERGEVHGTMSVLWVTDRQWIEQNKLNVMFRVSPKPYQGLNGVPALVDLARNEDERRLLSLFSSYTQVGMSFAAPPKVPKEYVAELRGAFVKMVADPELIADAQKMNLSLDPFTGEQLQKHIAEATNLPDALRERAIAAARGNAAVKDK